MKKKPTKRQVNSAIKKIAKTQKENFDASKDLINWKEWAKLMGAVPVNASNVKKYIDGKATFTKKLIGSLPFLKNTLPKMLLRDFYSKENSYFPPKKKK